METSRPTNLGFEVQTIDSDWRTPVDPHRLSERLNSDTKQKIKAVCIVHNETSTGVTSNIAEHKTGY
jgi:alanine-glyoxylate transaminase/serine-glyoxylate transaminase/serine-pyruvate transaminase